MNASPVSGSFFILVISMSKENNSTLLLKEHKISLFCTWICVKDELCLEVERLVPTNRSDRCRSCQVCFPCWNYGTMYTTELWNYVHYRTMELCTLQTCGTLVHMLAVAPVSTQACISTPSIRTGTVIIDETSPGTSLGHSKARTLSIPSSCVSGLGQS